MSDTGAADRAKPSTPLQIRRQTWTYIGRRAIQEFVRDGCVDAAAALTFFAVLSVFPAGLAVMALVGVLADTDEVLDRLLTLLAEVAPPAVTDTLRAPLTDAAGTSAAGITLIVAIVTAVWSASIYVSGFGRILNRIYGVPEGRPYWKRKPWQLGVTVVLLALALVVVGVVVLSGPVARAAGHALGIGDTALGVWNVVKWPVLATAVVMMITLLYKGTSNLKQPPLRWLGLGAAFAVGVLSLASAGLFIYVSNFADYNRTFGSLAGVVVFLLWLFVINVALLIGAEFNAELERGRQLQAGQKAESELQLPLRESTGVDRTERSREITIERGTRLRRGETLSPREDTVFRRAKRFLDRLWHRNDRRS
ncbi:YihY/virulence factor BrkB family protein [Microbacterium sp. 3H14]|uniref:YihY/virulence factor BrkB family protein n=1 Tax=unclassified Microbacterium TaxID=2609290 RepID=UPI00106C8A2E|nr:YihY/virulence factor BrkB family protein [Microbacterium sp. 3H14]TFB16992.1 YihY/virulence factor BrkB family protein [Microbacterium sp. 3H14]